MQFLSDTLFSYCALGFELLLHFHFFFWGGGGMSGAEVYKTVADVSVKNLCLLIKTGKYFLIGF